MEDGITNPAIGYNKEYMESDDRGAIIEGDVKLGTLTERFLSCFIPFQSDIPDAPKPDDESKFCPVLRTRDRMMYNDERLKQELYLELM
jgi:hypothetical protein